MTAPAPEERHLSPVEQVKAVGHSLKRVFSSDGCSSAPDFDFGATCCLAHDRDYFEGTKTRRVADRDMRRCIAEKGYIVLPWVYWLGVRVGGWYAWAKHRRAERVE